MSHLSTLSQVGMDNTETQVPGTRSVFCLAQNMLPHGTCRVCAWHRGVGFPSLRVLLPPTKTNPLGCLTPTFLLPLGSRDFPGKGSVLGFYRRKSKSRAGPLYSLQCLRVQASYRPCQTRSSSPGRAVQQSVQQSGHGRRRTSTRADAVGPWGGPRSPPPSMPLCTCFSCSPPQISLLPRSVPFLWGCYWGEQRTHVILLLHFHITS